MKRYVICFSKTDYIKYISHLDTLRLFKRAFKRAGIALEYFRGFNPHPRLSFALPLPLGYAGLRELMEFETSGSPSPEEIAKGLGEALPRGICIKTCVEFNSPLKSLTSAVTSATYEASFPLKRVERDFDALLADYLALDRIMAGKRQKKTGETVEEDIKGKIRRIKTLPGENLILEMELDSGSSSSLSPARVLSSFIASAGLDVELCDIQVERTAISFLGKLPGFPLTSP